MNAVQQMFDEYGPSFEATLVNGLGYCAPTVILGALSRHFPLQFTNALDLGCGTGLMGVRLRPFAKRLVGVDFSPGMLEQARLKNCYDEIIVADINTFLVETADRYDLIVAADVLVYFEGLSSVFSAIKKALLPDGIFAASLESHEGDGVEPRARHRYAHSRSYVASSVRDAGLSMISLEPVSTRIEANLPVPFLITISQVK